MRLLCILCLSGLFASCALAQDLPSGSGTPTRPLPESSINGAIDPTKFPGADIGAQLNAAIAACTANGIHIQIPPGRYPFSTPIVFSGSCIPQIDAQAVEMDYRGTGQAITFSGLNIRGGFAGPKVLRGLHLVYRGHASTSVVGIAVGDTSGAACCGAGIRLENDWIDNFGIDLLFGSNAWNFSAIGDFFSASAAGKMLVSFPSGPRNSGESLRFTNSSFFSSGAFLTNGINISNGGTSSSWDGDNFDNVEVELLAGNNSMTSPYWENPDAPIPAGHFFLVGGAAGALFNPYFFPNKGWDGPGPHFMASITGAWSAAGSQAINPDASPCTAFYSVAASARLTVTGTGKGCNPVLTAHTPAGAAEKESEAQNNPEGFKHVRTITTCTTDPALGSVCTFAVPLPGAAFPDTNFTSTCTAVGATRGVPILTVRTITVSQLELQIQAGSAAAATITEADCIAVHD